MKKKLRQPVTIPLRGGVEFSGHVNCEGDSPWQSPKHRHWRLLRRFTPRNDRRLLIPFPARNSMLTQILPFTYLTPQNIPIGHKFTRNNTSVGPDLNVFRSVNHRRLVAVHVLPQESALVPAAQHLCQDSSEKTQRLARNLRQPMPQCLPTSHCLIPEASA